MYNQSKEIALKIALGWTHCDQFRHHMKEHTAHLDNPPFIQTLVKSSLESEGSYESYERNNEAHFSIYTWLIYSITWR